MPESHAPEPDKQQLRPTALALEDAARLFTSLGGMTVTVEMIQADIDAGAPVNPDGTINLVHYGAWLVGEVPVGD